MLPSRKLFLAGFLLCFLMLLTAGYFQMVEHLEPCPLCIIQRVLTLVAAVVFALAALQNPRQYGLKIYGFLVLLIALSGAATSVRHVWLQNLPADQVSSCGPGLNFILDNFPLAEAVQMVLRGSGECAKVLWTFMGLSIPAWTGMAFVLMALIGWKALASKTGKTTRWNDIRG